MQNNYLPALTMASQVSSTLHQIKLITLWRSTYAPYRLAQLINVADGRRPTKSMPEMVLQQTRLCYSIILVHTRTATLVIPESLVVRTKLCSLSRNSSDDVSWAGSTLRSPVPAPLHIFGLASQFKFSWFKTALHRPPFFKSW